MLRQECIINYLFVVIAIFVVCLLDSCSGGKQHIDEYADMPNFKKVFTQKSITTEEFFVKDGNDSVFTYSSMEEAEWKLVHYFFPDGKGTREKELDYFDFDYDLFEKVVMSDTSSMNYSFDSIRYYSNINIMDSKDGLVRFYIWEITHGGGGSDAQTLVQYRFDGKIRYQASLYKGWTGSSPIKLWTLHVNGMDYYMTADYFTYGGEDFIGYSVYVLTDTGLVEVAGYDSNSEEDGRLHAVSYELHPGDWYSRTSGMGYDWLNYYDTITNTLYVPEEDTYLNDRYLRYQWDGKKMKQIGSKSVANPFLHPSLREYEGLVFQKVSQKRMIRVDKMKNGKYRYSVWASKKKMNTEPDLVISNGIWNEKTEEFLFRNREYEYKVGKYNITVLKNGKKVLEEDFMD